MKGERATHLFALFTPIYAPFARSFAKKTKLLRLGFFICIRYSLWVDSNHKTMMRRLAQQANTRAELESTLFHQKKPSFYGLVFFL